MRCSNSQCNKTLPTTIRYCPYCGTPTLGIGALQRVTGSLSRLSYLPVRRKVVLSVAALGVIVFVWSQFSPSVNMRVNRVDNPDWSQFSPSVNMRINPKDNAEMIYIPPGEFIMGSSKYEDEKPQRKVYLDGYWIYKYEVTVAQYRKFCQDTGRKMPDAPSWGWIDDHPIVNVSWEDANAYALWAGGRLPTEAQWEKAARGTDGREYPWGNDWDASKLHCSKKEWGDAGRTAPVGSYPSGASPYGVMDMAGNVWEWCSDWYDGDYYKNAPSRNPDNTQMSTERSRVLRGGSWNNSDPPTFRCPDRNYDYFPDDWFDFLGFRVARQD